MCIISCGNNHKLNVFIPEEVLRCPVMLGRRPVDGAVRPLGRRRWVRRRLGALQNGHNLIFWDGADERQMKALGGAAVAYNADLNGGHGCDSDG